MITGHITIGRGRTIETYSARGASDASNALTKDPSGTYPAPHAQGICAKCCESNPRDSRLSRPRSTVDR